MCVCVCVCVCLWFDSVCGLGANSMMPASLLDMLHTNFASSVAFESYWSYCFGLFVFSWVVVPLVLVDAMIRKAPVSSV